MPSTVITGTGHYVPPRVVKNEDLVEPCETSDVWIRERTGIRERRFIEPGQTTSELGVLAAREALKSAGRTPKDVDCIIFATLSPDYCFPGSGCIVQDRLEIPGVPAFDVRNQCSGFLYSLQMADSFIRSGVYRCILVIGAEVHSTGLEFNKNGRHLTVLFGDGAGALVAEASEAPDRGVLRVELGADGHYVKDLWCEGPASSPYPERITPAHLARGIQYPRMNGRAVFRKAVSQMQTSVLEILEHTGHTIEDLDLLIPHQANLRISEMVRSRLRLAPEQVFSNIQYLGNTTAASIPIALDECVRKGLVSPGSLVGMVAFGSGFTWGAALIQW